MVETHGHINLATIVYVVGKKARLSEKVRDSAPDRKYVLPCGVKRSDLACIATTFGPSLNRVLPRRRGACCPSGGSPHPEGRTRTAGDSANQGDARPTPLPSSGTASGSRAATG